MALKTLKMDRTSRAWPTKVSGLRCLDYSLAPCRRPRSQPRSRLRSRLSREDGEKQTTTTENKGTQIKAEKVAPTADTSFTVKSITKLAWYASEAFGDVTAFFKGGAQRSFAGDEIDATTTECLLSWDETVKLLRQDYDRVYFVTGDLDRRLYQNDCIFADPFVSFTGLERFKKNLDNLGAFMEDVQLVIDDFSATENATDTGAEEEGGEGGGGGGEVTTEWKFKCTLNLPWRPVLAASGGTRHVFNSRNKMEQHIESWNIDPALALRQLLRPGPGKKKT